MKKAMSACVAAGFALATVILCAIWLSCNHVHIVITTEDQRLLADHYERDGMSDFTSGCEYRIRF